MAQVTAEFNLDVSTIEAWLKGYAEQLPFSQMRALNDLGFKLKNTALPGEAKQSFDRPKPFTSSSATWRVEKASKQNLLVLIYPERKREPYLRANIKGGQRGVKPIEAAFKGVGTGSSPASQFFPTDAIRRDRYGNVSRATLLKILDDAKIQAKGTNKYFIGRPRNSVEPYGIYKRLTTKIKPVFLPATRPMAYDRIYDIGSVADRLIKSDYQQLVEKYLKQALRTAK